MIGKYKDYSISTLQQLADTGFSLEEHIVFSPQGAKMNIENQEVLNFCTNNYLGLANNPQLIEASKKALDEWGYGLSAGRLLAGTCQVHKDLEDRISAFLGVDDTLLYTSCYDANTGLFETLIAEEDAIISDQLNHASIIDGIRLCKAAKYRYSHSNMSELEQHLQAAQDKRFRLIATDGVFSMDGEVAKLNEICSLAEKYDAMVMVDDSHATGFIGNKGRGTHDHCGVTDRVDIITSTLGKALGGANGGFTSGRQEIINLLRSKSRPFIFSNSLAPSQVGSAITCFDLLDESNELINKLMENTRRFRKKIKEIGFTITEGEHPIVPVMIGDAVKAKHLSADLFQEGVFVVAMAFPIVPKGQARIRVINSAAHSKEQVDFAIDKFRKIGKKLNII